MKKILVFPAGMLLGILFCFLFLKYCCKKDNPSTANCLSQKCMAYDGRPPVDLISFALARKMSDAYVRDIPKKTITDNGQRDATSISFELPKLKKFISYIEQVACKNGCHDSLQLGVRIYYAKYPDTTEYRNYLPSLQHLSKKYGKMHTLFFSPVYRYSNTGRWIDFDPAAVKAGCTIPPLDPLKGVVFMPISGIEDNGSDPMNHGGLRPPPYGINEVYPAEQ